MISLVTNGAAADANAATTGSLDTTGANLIVVGCTTGGVAPAVTDSKGNTWTALTSYGSAGIARLFYCVNPSVGSGHTFTNTATASNPGVFVGAFKRASAASPFDQENGNASDTRTATVQPGSITPSLPNELIVTIVAGRNSNANTIDGGFTITDQISGTGAGAMAYLIQSGASATNPTWTASGIGSNIFHAVIASFKAAMAYAQTTHRPAPFKPGKPR